MGTNYYAELPGTNPCPHCGRSDDAEELHIGKSSAGWCFSLHVIPEHGLNTLDDWKSFLSKAEIKIRDEYGDYKALPELLHVITERRWPHNEEKTQSWYAVNHAEPGPNNLVRHAIDNRHCIGHGEGTWDYITGEFS